MDEWLAYDLLNKGILMFSTKGRGTWECNAHRAFPEAPLAPFRLRMSHLASFPELHARVGIAYAETIRKGDTGIDRLAYLSSIMAPTAGIVSVRMSLPMLFSKHDGTRWKLQGEWNAHDRVGILDHVRMTDDAKITAFHQLKTYGATTSAFFVLIDFGASHAAIRGCPVVSVFRWWEMLSLLYQKGMISEQAYDASAAYHEDLHDYIRHLRPMPCYPHLIRAG